MATDRHTAWRQELEEEQVLPHGLDHALQVLTFSSASPLRVCRLFQVPVSALSPVPWRLLRRHRASTWPYLRGWPADADRG